MDSRVVNQKNFFINVDDVTAFMIFVFTEDIFFGLCHPVFFHSWDEVFKYTHYETVLRKQSQSLFLWQTDAASIDQRVNMWLTIHKKNDN